MGAGVRIETVIMPATSVAGAAEIGLAWNPREATRGVPWNDALPSVATTTGITSREDVVTRGRVSTAGARALLILVGAFGSPLPGISIIPPASGASFDTAAVRLGDIASLGAAAIGFAAFASPGPGITMKPLVSAEEEDASAASAWASSASAAARMAASAAWAAAA